MARNFKQDRTGGTKIVSDQEIWNTIRYLDPDGEHWGSASVAAVILVLPFVLIGVTIFLRNH